MMAIAPMTKDIKNLTTTYVEMQTIKDQLNEIVIASMQDMDMVSNNKTVPVFLPKKSGQVEAFVSEEDYDVVFKASDRWRQSTSGYPIFVKKIDGKFVTTYMHKLVFGGPSKHINGNRLDNTRRNLVSSRSANKRRRNSLDASLPPGDV